MSINPLKTITAKTGCSMHPVFAVIHHELKLVPEKKCKARFPLMSLKRGSSISIAGSIKK